MISEVVLTVWRNRFGLVEAMQDLDECIAFDSALFLPYERSELHTPTLDSLLTFSCLISNIVHSIYLSGANSNLDLSAELAQNAQSTEIVVFF